MGSLAWRMVAAATAHGGVLGVICLYEVVGEPLSPHSMSSHDMLGPRYEPHSSLTGGTKKES